MGGKLGYVITRERKYTLLLYKRGGALLFFSTPTGYYCCYYFFFFFCLFLNAAAAAYCREPTGRTAGVVYCGRPRAPKIKDLFVVGRGRGGFSARAVLRLSYGEEFRNRA